MEYRFSLNPQLDADLIAFICQKANGGSENKAMKLFAQNSFAIQMDRKVPSNGHLPVTDVSKQAETIDDNAINLSGLDAAFSELGE